VVVDIAQANAPPGSDRAGLALAPLTPARRSAAIWQKASGRHRRAATTKARSEPGRLRQKPPPIIIRRRAPTYRG